jgi:hypothetical protein
VLLPVCDFYGETPDCDRDDALTPFECAASDVVEFPELAALPDNLRNRSSIERFELGLQTVLDGIERRFLGQPG